MPSLTDPQASSWPTTQTPQEVPRLPKGYDFPRCREALRKRGITPRIARWGVESSEKLGRYRWAVERTLSWVNRFRRLKVHYERPDDIHQAFLDLGCALICWRYVQRLC
jgi:IS5 family transposase